MKTILITGINTGLGKALFDELVLKGHPVFGILRNEAAYNLLIKNKPKNANYILADISEDSCIDKIQAAIQSFKLDLVINNAGIQGEGMSIATTDSNEILNLINVHCLGVFRVMKAIQLNLNETQALVININSRLGSIHHQDIGTFKDMKVSYAYRIAKASQNMLTASLRLEFKNTLFASITPGRLSTREEYQASAQKIIAHWENNKFENTTGILEVPDKLTEW